MLGPLSFSAILQIRLSDSLIPLGYNRRVGKAAIFGTTLGALVSNIFSFYGFYDLLIGSIANFFASLIPYLLRSYKGFIAKIVATTLSCATVIFFVGFMLFNQILGIPLESSIASIALGSAISIVLLGTLLLFALEKVFSDNMWQKL
ncbi:MAG: QueT transporter family protein [Nitrososphaeria archaeon]|nr:QueT transporter family protein [Nitrososphaeria archaeon]